VRSAFLSNFPTLVFGTSGGKVQRWVLERTLPAAMLTRANNQQG
jgi:hypothetical protein